MNALLLRLIIWENTEENIPKLLCHYNQEKLSSTGCKNPHVLLREGKN